MTENPDNPVLVPHPLDLPPIPDVLLDAFEQAHDNHPDSHREIAAEVWPHLYAAALRHAADEIHGNLRLAWRRLAADELRRLADTAAP